MAAAEPWLHERLSDWLQVRRPGTYDQVSGCLLYCRLCETSVKAVRSNNIHWVLQHECTDLHWNKVHSSDSRPCLGVRIHPDLEGKFLIQHYKASLDTWIQEKMPWCHERSSPHSCRADSEGFSWVQSAGCVEAKKQLRGEDLACAACRRPCNNEVFCKRIALWGATFDLVELLHMLYCGQTTRRNEILEGMQSADYAPVLEQTGRVALQDLRQWTYNQVHELLTANLHVHEYSVRLLQQRSRLLLHYAFPVASSLGGPRTAGILAWPPLAKTAGSDGRAVPRACGRVLPTCRHGSWAC